MGGGDRPKWKKLGRSGRIIASASFRGLLQTSVDSRGFCGQKPDAGEFLGKDRKMDAAAETRSGWPNYCVRQLPWTSLDIRGFCGRKMDAWNLLGKEGVMAGTEETRAGWKKY